MLCGIPHNENIAVFNGTRQRRSGHCGGPGTAPSGSRLSLGAGRKSTGVRLLGAGRDRDREKDVCKMRETSAFAVASCCSSRGDRI